MRNYFSQLKVTENQYVAVNKTWNIAVVNTENQPMGHQPMA